MQIDAYWRVCILHPPEICVCTRTRPDRFLTGDDVARSVQPVLAHSVLTAYSDALCMLANEGSTSWRPWRCAGLLGVGQRRGTRLLSCSQVCALPAFAPRLSNTRSAVLANYRTTSLDASLPSPIAMRARFPQRRHPDE